MKLAVTVLILLVLGYIGGHIYVAYKESDEAKWYLRLYSATKDSATLFWGLIVSWVTVAFNGIMNMSDFLGAPEVREFITKNLSPELASGVIVGIVFLLCMSRLRTLTKRDD